MLKHVNCNLSLFFIHTIYLQSFFAHFQFYSDLFQIKQRQEALRIQKEQQLISKQQSILHSQPFVQDVEVCDCFFFYLWPEVKLKL